MRRAGSAGLIGEVAPGSLASHQRVVDRLSGEESEASAGALRGLSRSSRGGALSGAESEGALTSGAESEGALVRGSTDGAESEGTISQSSMPALVPADSSDDDLLFDHPPAAPPAGSGDEECVLGMACAACGTAVVMASELLSEQTARLERKVYPYELDFLDEENAWCYSATNGSDERYDVARFGGDARFRFRVRGKPTDAVSFFPPYRWSPAACPRCSTLLGWHFTKEEVEIDEADEAEPEPNTNPSALTGHAALEEMVEEMVDAALGSATGLHHHDGPAGGAPPVHQAELHHHHHQEPHALPSLAEAAVL